MSSDKPPVRLGPFELQQIIGRGGMGVVWRAYHARDRVPVAVKVLTVDTMRSAEAQGAFTTEVRAVGALSHPNIVMVYDHGVTDDLVASESRGTLAAGCPWLALEYADGGSFDKRRTTPLTWSELRTVLLSLLDALAHAHAHGIVHLDLKPGNVLVGGLRPGVKLTDFGLAQVQGADDPTDDLDHLVGTPAYMAPEQFGGNHRDFGPWTDLYALGCVAWGLASGSPPFGRPKPVAAMIAHLSRQPPALVPRQPVPPGFSDWLLRLLAKDPAERYRRAADAAHGLRGLGDAVEDEVGDWLNETEDLPTSEVPRPADSRWRNPTVGALGELDTIPVDMIATHSWSETPSALDPLPTFDAGSGLLATTPRQAGDRPPFPPTWRHDTPQLPALRLLGAGLGLYGIRAIPVIGREKERDIIWEALRTVIERRLPQALVLTGAAGTGKSRLAEWISVRAHEVGATEQMKAVHSPTGGGLSGLASMVERYLRCQGLARAQVAARIEGLFRAGGSVDPYQWMALTQLVAPAEPEDLRAGERPPLFGSPSERYAVLANTLRAVARDRPVVAWLDDVQWGGDTLAFCEHVLADPDPVPVLFVLTARTEALAERPAERAQVNALLQYPSCAEIRIDRLGKANTHELVENLLGLEGAVAAQVEERCGGNPLFAVQLVGDWVERGVLQPGERGWVLTPGASVVLPDDLHAIWASRAERVLEGHCAEAGHALELAATLGQDVDEQEWRAACEVARLPYPDGLVDQLVAARLARTNERGWSLLHGMLKESLVRRSQEAGRDVDHNRACVAMLSSRGGVHLSERLGRHLAAAGVHQEALRPLYHGARDRLRRSDYRGALALCIQREEVIEELAPPADDPRWGEGWVIRAQALRQLGVLEEARSWAQRAVDAARMHGWPRVLLSGLIQLGSLLRVAAELDAAEAVAHEILELASRSADHRRAVSAMNELGWVARWRGDLDQALSWFERSRALNERLGDELGVASCLYAFGAIDLLRGEYDRAEARLSDGLERFARLGARASEAAAINALAESARLRGDLDAAEEGYKKAVQIHRALGSSQLAVCQYNLAVVEVMRGNYSAARQELNHLVRVLERTRRPYLEGVVRALRLPCDAHADQWEPWDRHRRQLEQALARHRPKDGDVSWALELAGDLARQKGEEARATAAFRLAAAHLEYLGQTDNMKRLLAKSIT